MSAEVTESSTIRGTVTVATAARRPLVDRVGTWAAALTAVFAAAALAIGVTTPPRSGPFAPSGTALAYPFVGAARFVPRDFVWMYPAFLMMLGFLVLAACVHARARGERRFLGRLGLTLATVAFTVIAIDYFIQLQVVQPGLAAGEGAGLAALSQYNPHGVFIALEDLGFLITAVSFTCIALSLGASRLERVARWTLLLASAASVVTCVTMWAYYGLDLGYRFEVTVIAIVWLALIVGGTLLALAFRSPEERATTGVKNT